MGFESCGCERKGNYQSLCRFHWNEFGLRAELERARSWEHSSRLDPADPADAQVLRFYEQLCYWAAKGIGDAGSVGDIYSAADKALAANRTRLADEVQS